MEEEYTKHVLQKANEHLKRIVQHSSNDNYPTESSYKQIDTERACEKHLRSWWNTIGNPEVCKFQRQKHTRYLMTNFSKTLPGYFSSLDASRPWIVFWIVHSLDLLDILDDLDSELKSNVVSFLKHCESEHGGYGGGPMQFPHLAPTFASVSALLTIGTEEALCSIDRRKLYNFLQSCHNEDGSFSVHVDGEADVRGAYTACAVAEMTNLKCEELFKNTPEWLHSCQTYEGGFSGEPGEEAHGGYALCGLGGLVILGEESRIDLDALIYWACARQMNYSGGFQGRTNKIVDGCYSYWVGGLFPIFDSILRKQGKQISENHYLLNELELQKYLLNCCQFSTGGLVDKPPKRPDFYHTCYTLSGLSINQTSYNGKIHNLTTRDALLRPTDAVLNICKDKLEFAQNFYSQEQWLQERLYIISNYEKKSNNENNLNSTEVTQKVNENIMMEIVEDDHGEDDFNEID